MEYKEQATRMMERDWETSREQEIAQIFSSLLHEIYIFDAETLRFVEVNKSAASRLGYTVSKLMRLTPLDLKPHLNEQEFRDLLGPLRTGEELEVVYETRHQTKSGLLYLVEERVQTAVFMGRPVFVATAFDISGRQPVEIGLTETEEELVSIIETTPECVKIVDQHGVLLRMNLAGLEMIEAKNAEQVVGQSVYPIIVREYRRKFKEFNERVCAGEKGKLQFEIMGLEGTRRYMDTHAVPVYDRQTRQYVQLAVTRDITEQRKTERALRESEERFRRLVENAPFCIHTIDMNGRLTSMNPTGLSMMNVKEEREIQGRDYLEAVAEEDLPLVAQLLELAYEGQPSFFEFKSHADTETRLFESCFIPIQDAAGRVIQLMGVMQDITERRKGEKNRLELERQMLHVQKLESLGVLAGGIAHDFNNLLTSILGYAGLVQHTLPEDVPAQRFIKKVIQGTERATSLTKQMLAYSGKGHFVVRPLNLSELVEEMSQLLDISISKRCKLTFDFLPELPPIEADATQMQQVVMNLIMNASDAIGDEDGEIKVKTGVRECGRAYLSETYLDEKLPSGRYVYLEVKDNGGGMTAETRKKIFDPFFTTKLTGRGLGLAAVLGIVRGHKGAIKIMTEKGSGTTFTVLFPISTQAALPARKPKLESVSWNTSGTALVVDDDDSVRTSARDMLETMGFSVLTAADGRAGLALFERQSREINLVLLDLTMPYMNGQEVYDQMQKILPGVPTVLSSGYNEPDALLRITQSGFAKFVQKPYSFDGLQTAVRELVES